MSNEKKTLKRKRANTNGEAHEQTALERLQDEYDNFKVVFNKQLVTIAEQQSSIDKLKQENKQFKEITKKRFSGKNTALEFAINNEEKAKAELETLNHEVSNLRAKKHELLQDNEKLKTSHKRKHNDFMKTQTLLAEVEEERKRLKETKQLQTTLTKIELHENETAFTQLNTDYHQLQEDFTVLEAQHQATSHLLGEKVALLSQLEAQLEKKDNEMKAIIQKNRETLESVHETLDEKHAELNGLKVQYDALLADYKELYQTESEQTLRIVTLQNTLESKQHALQQNESARGQQEAKIQALTRADAFNRETIQNLKGRIHALNTPVNDKKQTLLHLAVLNKDLTKLSILLNAGAEVDCCDNEHKTPLHHALEIGALLGGDDKRYEMVKPLLEHGPNIYVGNLSIKQLVNSDKKGKTIDLLREYVNDYDTVKTETLLHLIADQKRLGELLQRVGELKDTGFFPWFQQKMNQYAATFEYYLNPSERDAILSELTAKGLAKLNEDATLFMQVIPSLAGYTVSNNGVSAPPGLSSTSQAKGFSFFNQHQLQGAKRSLAAGLCDQLYKRIEHASRLLKNQGLTHYQQIVMNKSLPAALEQYHQAHEEHNEANQATYGL